jgi:aspartyl-tRNA(Asn)/glutamyl-tRNA(Gln) amidotransferase subunit A
MTVQEHVFEDVAHLASLIERKEVSPVALTQAYLERIERLDQRLGAYITVCRDEALAAARTAESEILRGEYRGPLHGVPIGLKDQFFTKGIRTTMGSKIYADLITDEDATVVSRLKESGAILLGKHNLAEFALGGTRKHPFGDTRNPWDLDRIPGHSSSGSGVAVAASLCAAAIGEDTGGSGRIPAAACGIVAIRPTYGRVSRHGIFPACWSMDTASPMTKSVEDCAIVLQAIAGHDPQDRMSSRMPVPDYRRRLGDGVRGMRVGVIKELVPPESAHPDIREAFHRSTGVFQGLGASVDEVSVPLISLSAPFFTAICDTDAAHVHFDLLRTRAEDYDSATRARLMSASLVSAGIYNKAQRARCLLRDQTMSALSRFDVLLSPMSNNPTPRFGEENPVFQSTEEFIKLHFGARSFTTPYSLAALPALTVPCGFTSSGMPIGLQIGGRAFDEETLLRAAFAFESDTEWHDRRPPDL